jgi:hypothetical protein
MLESVHGKETAEKLLRQAQNIEMLAGRLPVTIRPGDTLTTVIQRAREAASSPSTTLPNRPRPSSRRGARRDSSSGGAGSGQSPRGAKSVSRR